MIDVSKLPVDVLEAVRQRLGHEEDDSLGDSEIVRASPERIAALYAGWYLGDESWGEQILSVFRAAEKAAS